MSKWQKKCSPNYGPGERQRAVSPTYSKVERNRGPVGDQGRSVAGRLSINNEATKEKDMTIGGNEGSIGRLGPRVQRVDTGTTAYICSEDVVELLERVDEYVAGTEWKIVTLDRTLDGQYYAFLTLF